MQNRILTSRFVQRTTVALGAAALPALSFAQGLPQLENPTRGAGSGIMETIRNYGYDIIMLVALLVVASMFIGVCYHATAPTRKSTLVAKPGANSASRSPSARCCS